VARFWLTVAAEVTTMNARKRERFPSMHRAAAACAVLLAAVALSTAPAWAGHGHGRGHHRHSHPVHHRHSHGCGHGHPVARPYHAPAWRPVVVPRVLVPRAVYEVEPYRAGYAYYAPHHHHHALYRFPVVVDGAHAWRTHAYCGDHLVSGAHLGIATPNFGLHVRF
jgi:hypothetical protein